MKRVLLTTMQRDVLEQVIAQHGIIVTTQNIVEKLSFATEESKYRFVSQLSEAGWLVRIKHGLYQIADISSLGTLTISPYTVAQLLHPESYVSFQAALHFHGLFDQSLRSVSCVTTKQKASTEVQGVRYFYVKTKADYFFGFTREAFDGQWVQIAQAEKAVIDLMQFRRSSITVDMVVEILRDNHHNVDLDRLVTYALRSPVAVQRTLGFLLDTLHLGGKQLHQAVKQSTSVTKLTDESSQYSSAWRLYYDPYFTRETLPI